MVILTITSIAIKLGRLNLSVDNLISDSGIASYNNGLVLKLGYKLYCKSYKLA